MKSGEFRALTDLPLNGAPSPAALVRAHTTDVGDFFVRNHGVVPARDALPGGVRVTGLVRTPLTLALQHSFMAGPGASPPTAFLAARASVEATLQCAGNRRTSLQRIRPIPNEVPWSNEAIGNALWEGLRLATVLELAGIHQDAKHIWFFGGEELTGKHAGGQFGASIPVEKAMDGSVLLADTMNGAALTCDHGAPVRAVVPGYIGARSVKWLTEIRAEREPSSNHFQRAYSVFPPSMLTVPDGHAGGAVLGEMPLNSAFGAPTDGEYLSSGNTTVRGWALAGGDRTVKRVEVSPDGGSTWAQARFVSPEAKFVWRLWEADVKLTRGNCELACRAFDSAGNSQPSDPGSVWNVKGYANNSWDRVRISVS